MEFKPYGRGYKTFTFVIPVVSKRRQKRWSLGSPSSVYFPTKREGAEGVGRVMFL